LIAKQGIETVLSPALRKWREDRNVYAEGKRSFGFSSPLFSIADNYKKQ